MDLLKKHHFFLFLRILEVISLVWVVVVYVLRRRKNSQGPLQWLEKKMKLGWVVNSRTSKTGLAAIFRWHFPIAMILQASLTKKWNNGNNSINGNNGTNSTNSNIGNNGNNDTKSDQKLEQHPEQHWCRENGNNGNISNNATKMAIMFSLFSRRSTSLPPSSSPHKERR